MKTYPTISNMPLSLIEGKNVVAFDKLDGSNIRAEWSSKKGFYKFGSRKKLIDGNDHQFGEAVELINETSNKFNKIFLKNKIDRAVCFFEFWGHNSCFGSHQDEDHYVSLIDVSTYKNGIIDPEKFINWFAESVCIPSILFEGKIDKEFVDSVRNGTLRGIGPEGVVCKSGFDKRLGGPWMVKIKRQSWYDRLKHYCADDDAKYKELA